MATRWLFANMRLRSEKLREVIVRLGAGDSLKEYPTQRILLHSSDLQARPSIEITRHTVNALAVRGLIYPVRQDAGFNYEITEVGETLARVFSEKTFAHE